MTRRQKRATPAPPPSVEEIARAGAAAAQLIAEEEAEAALAAAKERRRAKRAAARRRREAASEPVEPATPSQTNAEAEGNKQGSACLSWSKPQRPSTAVVSAQATLVRLRSAALIIHSGGERLLCYT